MEANNKQKVRLSSLNDNLYTDFPNFQEKWNKLVKYYPKQGESGFTFSFHHLFGVRYAEYIIYRNEEGEMVGIITYYLHDYFHLERAGNLNISVDPKYWRNGIGLKLLKEAIRKWNIDFNKQTYTRSGIRLLLTFLNIAETRSHFELVI